jgi:prophage tail gpP-like protein
VAEELTNETPNIVLKVDGARYEGWTSLRARRSIETAAGSFHLSVTEKWLGQAVRPIRKFQPCQLLLNDQPIITGYVDDVDPEYDDKTHTIAVRGRCKTADLVDCSAIYKSGQWVGRKIEHIAANLCEPFGIKVITNVDTGAPFSSFNIQQGETVFECIERAARMRALLLVSDVHGNLVITRASTEKLETRLVQKENTLGAKGKFSGKDQYSHYIVKGQSRGTDDWFAEQAAQGKAEVRDASVPRYRPLIIVAYDQGGGTTLHDRAVWERNVRMGRGSRATIPVQGWSHADGLWMPNKLVDVFDPFLDLNTEMLISAVDYSIDDNGGTLAEIEIVRREAFELVEGVRLARLDKKLRHKDRRERKRGREKETSFWAFDLGVDE